MMDDRDLDLAEMIATNTRDVPHMMQRLVDEVRDLRERKEATLEQSDADEGITMLREANASFGNYTAPTRAVPELSDEGRDFLKLYAEGLASLAANMKLAAAKFRGDGDEMAALLIIRVQLSTEETGEWAEALASGDLAAAAKELVDMSYVNDGHYLTLGLGDLKLPLYREVHRSNMTKLGPDGKPIISEAGRWVKGPGYRPAVLEPILFPDEFRTHSDVSAVDD